MRLAILRLLAVYLSSAALVVTQSQTADPGPSPAASIGCVPHNDHWDCEGPRVTSSIITTTSAIPAASESTHDESAPVTGSNLDPGPSPTASVGCVPHGDHWDCEGPAPASAASSSGSDSGILVTATSTTTTAAVSEPTHDESAPVTGSNLDPGPSPTASIGCVPHGDHWDCEGPAPASAISSSGRDSGILATASVSASANSSANAVATGTSRSSTSSAPAQYTGAGSAVSLERHFIAALEAGVVGFGIFLAAA